MFKPSYLIVSTYIFHILWNYEQNKTLIIPFRREKHEQNMSFKMKPKSIRKHHPSFKISLDSILQIEFYKSIDYIHIEIS